MALLGQPTLESTGGGDATEAKQDTIIADLPKNNATDNNYSFVSGGDFTAVLAVFEIADDTRYKIHSPWIDITNFTNAATITFQFHRATAAAGAGYLEASSAITKVVGTDKPIVEFSDWAHYGYTKITALSNNGADNNIDVKFGYIKEALE